MAAAEDQSEAPAAQTDSGGDEKWTMKQTLPAVIEIHDSVTEYEEEDEEEVEKEMERKEEEAGSGAGQPEEKAFVLSLHLFMKEKGSPIERIPHLGFKQINLWRIYKAVEKRGGYDLVTAQRLWKKVYDELGGSPGSTSAATCTRRHYERLVLPFERHMKGEEDKPLPPSKPRKPYKRNPENKVKKCEIKRKRCQVEEDMDSHILAQRNPGPAGHGEAVMHLHSGLWTATPDRQYPTCSQPNRDICSSVYAILPVHSSPQPAPLPAAPPAAPPAAAAEVISPLEKKKRIAQASLNRPTSPQGEDIERPSVICCSQSPARVFSRHNCSSSEGSPQPLSSSSSSRSPSPLSVSSEDNPQGGEDKPALNSEIIKKQLRRVEKKSNCSEINQSLSCPQVPISSAGPNKDIALGNCQSLPPHLSKCRDKDSGWEPIHRVSSKYPHYSLQPTPSSSFYKVIPRSVQPLRPAPIRPTYQDEPTTRKLTNIDPWFHQTEKREKCRTGSQKFPHQQGMVHSAAQLPVFCVLSGYDKSVRDSRPQPPLHSLFLPNRMRLPQSQLMYHHRVPVGPAPPAIYPYPYSVPLIGPHPGYTLPAINPAYTQKL